MEDEQMTVCLLSNESNLFAIEIHGIHYAIPKYVILTSLLEKGSIIATMMLVYWNMLVHNILLLIIIVRYHSVSETSNNIKKLLVS